MGLKINFKLRFWEFGDPKSFSDFAETFFIISSEKKNRSISGKNYKYFLSEKNPTSILKIGGILAKFNIP